MPILLLYLAVLAVMSLIAFILFGRDKKMAGSGTAVRIKEKTLLAVTAYGGAIGAFFGRIVFRHKTKKINFSVVIGWSLILQLAALAVLLLDYGGVLA